MSRLGERSVEDLIPVEVTALEPDGDQGSVDEVGRIPVQVAARAADRAVALEDELRELRLRVAELETALAESEASASALSSTHAIELAVQSAGAVDAETVAVLVALAVDSGDAGSVTEGVAQVRSRKPHLFEIGTDAGARLKRGGSRRGSSGPEPAAVVAAREAVASGERSALLRYLRLRRSVL